VETFYRYRHLKLNLNAGEKSCLCPGFKTTYLFLAPPLYTLTVLNHAGNAADQENNNSTLKIKKRSFFYFNEAVLSNFLYLFSSTKNCLTPFKF